MIKFANAFLKVTPIKPKDEEGHSIAYIERERAVTRRPTRMVTTLMDMINNTVFSVNSKREE